MLINFQVQYKSWINAQYDVQVITQFSPLSQDIDGIACSFSISLDRKERMDFSFLTWSEAYRLVVPRPGEESRIFAFVRPFQPTVRSSRVFFQYPNAHDLVFERK